MRKSVVVYVAMMVICTASAVMFLATPSASAQGLSTTCDGLVRAASALEAQLGTSLNAERRAELEVLLQQTHAAGMARCGHELGMCVAGFQSLLDICQPQRMPTAACVYQCERSAPGDLAVYNQSTNRCDCGDGYHRDPNNSCRCTRDGGGGGGDDDGGDGDGDDEDDPPPPPPCRDRDRDGHCDRRGPNPDNCAPPDSATTREQLRHWYNPNQADEDDNGVGDVCDHYTRDRIRTIVIEALDCSVEGENRSEICGRIDIIIGRLDEMDTTLEEIRGDLNALILFVGNVICETDWSEGVTTCPRLDQIELDIRSLMAADGELAEEIAANGRAISALDERVTEVEERVTVLEQAGDRDFYFEPSVTGGMFGDVGILGVEGRLRFSLHEVVSIVPAFFAGVGFLDDEARFAMMISALLDFELVRRDGAQTDVGFNLGIGPFYSHVADTGNSHVGAVNFTGGMAQAGLTFGRGGPPYFRIGADFLLGGYLASGQEDMDTALGFRVSIGGRF